MQLLLLLLAAGGDLEGARGCRRVQGPTRHNGGGGTAWYPPITGLTFRRFFGLPSRGPTRLNLPAGELQPRPQEDNGTIRMDRFVSCVRSSVQQ